MKHILICRTDNIGDVVLTLPMAGYLRRLYPDCRIDLLCRGYVAPLMAHCRHFNQVITLESIGDARAFFAASGVDTVIFAYPDRRLAAAAWRARVPRRVGTSHRLYHLWYCNRLARFSRVNSPLHEAQLNFALLRPLGIDHVPGLAELPALYGLEAPALADTGPDIQALARRAPYNLVLHTKSNGNGREWPLAHYTALARRLQARPDIRLWVTGSAAEGQLLAREAPELLALPNVDNLCGRVDLPGLGALIGACSGLLASGTGPLHVAAALGRPTLGLFPQRKPIDAGRWGALGLRARSLSAHGSCPGCDNAATCSCMTGITPEQVEAILLSWCVPEGDAVAAAAADLHAAPPQSGPRTLVISPNWIGDAVMAQPLLQLLRARHPERPIDVLAPPAVAPAWQQMREVSEVLQTPFRHGALQLRERWRYARLLKARGYAEAYVLPNTLKYALIPWLAGIARRVGYKGESRHGLINVMHHDDVPPRPMVPFYAALADAPGAPLRGDVPRPALRVTAAQMEAAAARAGLAVDRPLVVFAPGAEFGPAKRWPPAHFAALARQVVASLPQAQVALLGSPKDRPVCDEIVAAVAGSDAAGAVFNLAGQTSLAEAIALIGRSAAIVSNDSGLLHVASSLDRPVVAIYGPTDPDHAPPFATVARSLSLRLACAPCRQRECPLGHHDCMRGLDAGMVWQALQPMLGASRIAATDGFAV
ncbi:lipopolysaccharide heptosyltransferase II [[Empedobacter] haloabium]|uniref:lipopolysaccharide heptosyltransferase II n=1 Tax=[Empedobacter] haloabium TaxID=592317 RepID=A0ABZ1UI33_9BURK